jgi:hypothetical protein
MYAIENLEGWQSAKAHGHDIHFVTSTREQLTELSADRSGPAAEGWVLIVEDK